MKRRGSQRPPRKRKSKRREAAGRSSVKPIGPAGKVVRDPVHGLIRIEPEDEVILRLMDTPEFQRLRRIRQLGVSSLTYPGAEHSRFAHSLGVFNFAQRMLGKLRHRYRHDSTASDLLDQHAQTVKIAALLHDVGHSPFSHLLERAFGTARRHEQKTVTLLTVKDSSLPKILRRHKIDPCAVADIIEQTSAHRLLVDMVSSQLDADRMDYILRDALATGVKYGAFDAEWLLNSLCIGCEPGLAKPETESQWRLCLDERRGLHSAEQLIVARMHMSLQVYFHRVTRGWEAHLLCLFNVAAGLAAKNKLPRGTPQVVGRFFATRGDLNHAEFLQFDESTLLAAFQLWAAATDQQHARLASLARAFLVRQKTFRCRELPPLGFEKATTLERGLSQAGQNGVDWLLDEIAFNSYKDFGATFRKPQKSEPDEDQAVASTSAILLAGGELAAPSKPAETDSILLQALGEKQLPRLTRLYFRPEIEPQVRKLLADYQ